MDKNWKLQRYDRKSYSEMVDFPVEIVGRDGVVRRYTFEDSIRLYQRRITFAPIRYRDDELVHAEATHCRSRIGQLRRSYFHRYGWGTPEGQTAAQDRFGDLAGELAAFLCRVLSTDDRPDLHFDPVQDPGGLTSIWYITPQGKHSGMLLYLHRFEGADSDGLRESFFTGLKGMEQMGAASGDAERIIAVHHTMDCGFVLTGRGGDFDNLVQLADNNGRPVEVAPTPWDEVLEIVRKGDYEAAMRRCRDLAREQPYHRNAYAAGAMLGAFLGEAATGEDLALIGSRYFPEDGSLRYYLGLCRARLGRREDAERALREALALSPGLVSARSLLAVQLIQGGRHREALAVLADRHGVDPDDRRADADLQHLEHWVRWRAWMLYGGAVVALFGAFATWQFGPMGLVAVVLGTVLSGLGWFAFHRQLDAIVARQRFEEISQGLRRLHRQSRSQQVVS